MQPEESMCNVGKRAGGMLSRENDNVAERPTDCGGAIHRLSSRFMIYHSTAFECLRTHTHTDTHRHNSMYSSAYVAPVAVRVKRSWPVLAHLRAERSNDDVYTPKWQALFADWDHATKDDFARVRRGTACQAPSRGSRRYAHALLHT